MVDDDDTVARLGGHTWHFYGALSNAVSVPGQVSKLAAAEGRLSVRGCHVQGCAEVVGDLLGD